MKIYLLFHWQYSVYTQVIVMTTQPHKYLTRVLGINENYFKVTASNRPTITTVCFPKAWDIESRSPH